MSERKVLTKYYPPDFDPSAIGRTRKPKDAIEKLPTVRLMAPFSMKCTTCGEFIYKGRKFNARKEVTDEKYYAIKILRFYIRCTRCSSEITFLTDPKHGDYNTEKGAKRNFEPWRAAKLAEETEEERLDRLEKEEAEKDAMTELENKTNDTKTEMAVADALDEIMTRNARMERAGKAEDILEKKQEERDKEQERQEMEDAAAAKLAFANGSGERVKRLVDDDEPEPGITQRSTSEKLDMPPPAAPPSFARTKKRKQNFGAALGIKKKQAV